MWKIPLFKIYWDDDDVNNVSDVIKSGMNWATGPNIPIFEKDVAGYVGKKYAVSFNSGTSALHAVLLAHGIKSGDEIIVPSFTFIATANSPLFVNAKPVFADVEDRTYGLDPEDVKEKITKKTRAIMPVHVGGCPCNIRELREIANDQNILLIEDAAESLGAKIGKTFVGTYGESAMFSFCGPKVITTGEGGVIVTDSLDLTEKMRLIRSHGRAETKDYFSTNEYLDYVDLGYNFRMSNITAALGISQMKKIGKVIKMRRKNSEYLTKRLNKQVRQVETPNPPEDYYHLYQMYTLKVPKRDDLMNFLSEKGIMSKLYFPPVHQTHFYKNILKFKPKLPVTERMAKTCLTLPMYPGLTKNEADYMVDSIKDFYERD